MLGIRFDRFSQKNYTVPKKILYDKSNTTEESDKL